MCGRACEAEAIVAATPEDEPMSSRKRNATDNPLPNQPSATPKANHSNASGERSADRSVAAEGKEAHGKKIFPKRTGKKPNDAAAKMPPKVMPKNAFSPGLTPELSRSAKWQRLRASVA